MVQIQSDPVRFEGLLLQSSPTFLCPPYWCFFSGPHRIRVKSNEVEAILLDIQLGQQYMSLLCAYKPPAVTNNTFFPYTVTFS